MMGDTVQHRSLATPPDNPPTPQLCHVCSSRAHLGQRGKSTVLKQVANTCDSESYATVFLV